MDDVLQESDSSPSRWCGRVEFDLSDSLGRRVARIVLMLRLDHADFYLGDERHLACLRREVLREWLIHPHAPFAEDELVLFVDSGLTCMSFARSAGYVVPADIVTLFTAEV